MEQKTNDSKLALCAIKGIQEMEECAAKSGLERPLLELVRLRASQIKECQYCRELHTDDARDGGDSLQRLVELKIWRETNHFSEREKAALAWTEAIALSSERAVFDTLFEDGSHFTEQELLGITIAINAVNSWNSLTLSMQPPLNKEEQKV